MNILLRWPPTFALEITASACNFKASGTSIIQVSFPEQYFSIMAQFTQVVKKKKVGVWSGRVVVVVVVVMEAVGLRLGGFSASSTPDVKALIWPCEARNTFTSRTERDASGWRDTEAAARRRRYSESGISLSNLPNGTKSFSTSSCSPLFVFSRWLEGQNYQSAAVYFRLYTPE